MLLSKSSWVKRREGISGSREEELFACFVSVLGESKSELIFQLMRKNQFKKRSKGIESSPGKGQSGSNNSVQESVLPKRGGTHSLEN